MIDRLSKLYKAKDKLSENQESETANKEKINEIQSEINDIIRDKKLRQENPHSPELQALIDEKENLESSRLTKEKRKRLAAIEEMIVVQLINDRGMKVAACKGTDPREVFNVNTLEHLREAEDLLKED